MESYPEHEDTTFYQNDTSRGSSEAPTEDSFWGELPANQHAPLSTTGNSKSQLIVDIPDYSPEDIAFYQNTEFRGFSVAPSEDSFFGDQLASRLPGSSTTAVESQLMEEQEMIELDHNSFADISHSQETSSTLVEDCRLIMNATFGEPEPFMDGKIRCAEDLHIATPAFDNDTYGSDMEVEDELQCTPSTDVSNLHPIFKLARVESTPETEIEHQLQRTPTLSPAPSDVNEESPAPTPEMEVAVDSISRPLLLDLHRILYHSFGFDSFYRGQLQPIINAINGQDVIHVAPTNGGKSICFQVAALYQDGVRKGVTVVISPTIVLINEQVEKLQKNKISALGFHGELSLRQRGPILRTLDNDKPPPAILYTTPESLGLLEERLAKLNEKGLLARFVVDEAHLLYQWGESFRAKYLELPSLRERFPRVPFSFFSASLTVEDTQRIKDDFLIQAEPTAPDLNRKNLFYQVVVDNSEASTQKDIIEYLKLRPDERGIIFCAWTTTCEKVHKRIIKEAGIKAAIYHKQLPHAEARENLRQWITGEVLIMVGTCVLGHGIDVRVSFTIHYDMPPSLAIAMQETGRAGRNGKNADCIIYYRPTSIHHRLRLIFKNQYQADTSRELQELRKMVLFCFNKLDCRRTQLLKSFPNQHSQPHSGNCGFCDNCCDYSEYDRAKIGYVAEDIYLMFTRLRANKPRTRQHVTPKELIASIIDKTDDERPKSNDGVVERIRNKMGGEASLAQEVVVLLYAYGIFQYRPHGEWSFDLTDGPKAEALLSGELTETLTMDVDKEMVKQLQAGTVKNNQH